MRKQLITTLMFGDDASRGLQRQPLPSNRPDVGNYLLTQP